MESISGNVIREELPGKLTKSQDEQPKQRKSDEAAMMEGDERNEQRRNLLKQGNAKQDWDKDGDSDAERLQKNADMLHGFGSKDY